MALLNSNFRNDYTADGATTGFLYTFRILDTSHIGVYLDGVLQVGGYTVSGVGASTGGSVSFAVAPVVDTVVTLIRAIPLTQTVEYQAGGAFPAASHEKALDLIVMQNQQQQEELRRTLRWPVVAGDAANELPDPTDATNVDKALFIAADGLSLEARTIGDADMQSVLTTKGDLVGETGAGAVRVPVGPDGSTLCADSTQASGLQYRNPALTEFFDNKVMRVQQKVATAPPDRWIVGHLSDGAVTGVKDTGAPTGSEAGVYIPNSLKVTATTGDAAMAGGQYLDIQQCIEGYDAVGLLHKPFVVSFWVRATKVGIYSFALQNSGADRVIVSEYTINTTDTWERKTIVIPALDYATIGGTWNLTSGTGLRAIWTIAAGVGLQTANLSTWGPYTSAQASDNQVNGMETTSNTFYLTGVQIDLGNVASPLRIPRFEDELRRCRRYYQTSYVYGTLPGAATAVGTLGFEMNSTAHVQFVSFPTQMRAAPSVTGYSYSTGASGNWRNISTAADVAVTMNNPGDIGVTVTLTGTDGNQIAGHWAANADLA